MQPHALAADVAALVTLRDPRRLGAALTPTVRLQALLPGGPIRADGRADVAAGFRALFADFDTVEVVGSAGEAVADRLLIHYRLDVRQDRMRRSCTRTVTGPAPGSAERADQRECVGQRRRTTSPPSPPTRAVTATPSRPP